MPPDEVTLSDYPAFWIARWGRRWPIPEVGSILLGRSSDAHLQFDDDPYCSRRQARLLPDKGRHLLEPLSESVPVMLNGRPIVSTCALAHGDIVAFGAHELVYLARSAPDLERAASEADALTEIAASARPSGRRSRTPTARPGIGPRDEIPVRDRMIIGRSADADIVLAHPTVSRRHARIEGHRDPVTVADLGSANGTFVNGRRISGKTSLAAGDVVDVGPFTLSFTGFAFRTVSREGNIRVIGRNLSRTVAINVGGKATILDDVSVVIEPNEFVALLGPSGSGKTTLMNALSAREMASRGDVLINDVSLYSNFGLVAEQMALVPQHDMLHESLTLEQALSYTARLRLPADQSAATIREEIDRVLTSVEMSDRRTTRIGDLSGGQKKRASLANETLSRPSLLFLDEVTSGLDEGTDWEIMGLLRRLAESGMTIVCVTHTLANVREFCHKAIVMGAGGRLVFSGTPDEALDHFEVGRLADIYRRLPQHPVEDWQAEFQRSGYYRTYVAEPLGDMAASPSRLVAKPRSERSALLRRAQESLRQFAILTERNTRLLLADRKTLGMALLQSLIIGALLGYIFGDVTMSGPMIPSMLFLLGMTAFWLGCNGASKEIVKERPIYRRERDVNLSVLAYLGSKSLVNGVFTMAQVAIVFGLTAGLSDAVPGNNGQQMAILLLAGLVGTSLGLLISAAVESRDQATTIVPLALVPQFILAGVFVPDLPDAIEWLAQLAVSGLWTQEAMMAVYEGKAGPLWTGAAVLIAHGIAFFAIAYAVLFIRDGRGKLLTR